MAPNNPPEVTPEMLEQNPLLAICLLLFAMLFLALLAGAIASWCWLGYRLWSRQPWLKVAPWSPRVWGFADVIVTLVMLVSLQVLLTNVGVRVLGLDVEALRDGAEEPPLSLVALGSTSYLCTMAAMTLWIMLRFQVWGSHVGFTMQKTLKLIFVGLVAGLATLPIVYVVSALVAVGFETEYQHPILDAMRQDGSFFSYLLALFAAVLVAPLAEEFLFRVVLQGWLQSIPYSSISAAILGASEARRGDPEDSLFFHPASLVSRDGIVLESQNAVPTELSATPRPELENSPYRPPTNIDWPAETGAGEVASGSKPEVVPPIWPSVVTGVLFGLAHWGYGLSFVPLILLGIILGLLYRATHSIWPCVVVHFMLNASSMIALGLNVLLEQAAS